MAPTGAKKTRKSGEKTAHVKAVLQGLEKLYPEADCELHWNNPFQLLIATILSAQTTDKRVNQVTPELFATYPTPAALACADPSDVERIIRSTGFYQNKRKNIQGAAQNLVDLHDGQVPRTLDELIEIPGAARKTANVVLGTCWGIAEGVVVDTHVLRLSKRLGLTAQETPEKVEKDLMALLPRERWVKFSHQIIWHGRRVCDAKKPRCEECGLASICPSVRLGQAKAQKKTRAPKRR